VPDVAPASLPPGSDFSLVAGACAPPQAESGRADEAAAGDFEEVYNAPEHEGAWDAVLTCFFIDTVRAAPTRCTQGLNRAQAKNVVNYLRIIHKLLAPGGVWINLGVCLQRRRTHVADAAQARCSGTGRARARPSSSTSPRCARSRARSASTSGCAPMRPRAARAHAGAAGRAQRAHDVHGRPARDAQLCVRRRVLGRDEGGCVVDYRTASSVLQSGWRCGTCGVAVPTLRCPGPSVSLSRLRPLPPAAAAAAAVVAAA
jgi:hypothetical protein